MAVRGLLMSDGSGSNPLEATITYEYKKEKISISVILMTWTKT